MAIGMSNFFDWTIQAQPLQKTRHLPAGFFAQMRAPWSCSAIRGGWTRPEDLDRGPAQGDRVEFATSAMPKSGQFSI